MERLSTARDHLIDRCMWWPEKTGEKDFIKHKPDVSRAHGLPQQTENRVGRKGLTYRYQEIGVPVPGRENLERGIVEERAGACGNIVVWLHASLFTHMVQLSGRQIADNVILPLFSHFTHWFFTVDDLLEDLIFRLLQTTQTHHGEWGKNHSCCRACSLFRFVGDTGSHQRHSAGSVASWTHKFLWLMVEVPTLSCIWIFF